MADLDADMAVRGLLIDAFARIHDEVPGVVRGADEDTLTYRPDPEANSIGWLVWHLTRVQDDHIAGIAGVEQAWTAGGWHERFGLPFLEREHGYGHSSEQVAAVKGVPAADFLSYHEAVHDLTRAYLERVDADELARVVDDAWQPPVTASVRLVSVIGDCLQHLGQAAYLRGLADRREDRPL